MSAGNLHREREYMAKFTLINTLHIFFVEWVLLLLTEHGPCCHFQWRFLWQKGRGTEKTPWWNAWSFLLCILPKAKQSEGGRKKEEESSQKQQLEVSLCLHSTPPTQLCSALFPLELNITGIHKAFYKYWSPPRALVCLQNWGTPLLVFSLLSTLKCLSFPFV